MNCEAKIKIFLFPLKTYICIKMDQLHLKTNDLGVFFPLYWKLNAIYIGIFNRILLPMFKK